ncbi:MAG: O-antigen ligase domain-containing protein, partial [Tannerellaceae bacterium]|nr:O-antigen ligase domain-containing protein [Tannerellaceae bacterium]
MIQSFIDKSFYALFLFTLTFGILLYDAIGFDYTDEFCALFLFFIFAYYMFNTDDWRINKAFLTTIGIFVFYLCYSFYIHSNSTAGIVTDLLIQIKPYLAFFCVYSMAPRFSADRKEMLKGIALIFWGFLLLVGIGDLFIDRLIYNVMGHPAYFAAGVIITSLCYFYCSKYTLLDKITFLLLLSIGILSGRSKFYGFYALAFFIVIAFSFIRQLKLNVKTVLFGLLMLAVILFVAREKINFYFYQTVTGEIDRDMIARYVLYNTAPEILRDYFPFGSGFASYGSFASGLYYSHIYVDYGIDGVWGITRSFYSFIADTYYPSLAQFGVAGILLYITFWFYILRKAWLFFKETNDLHYFTIIILIVGFFAIEGTTDSTFTTHRGFFVLMMTGMILSNMRQDSLNQAEHENPT